LFGPILYLAAWGALRNHHCNPPQCTVNPQCPLHGNSLLDTTTQSECTCEHTYTKLQNFIKSWNQLQGNFLDSQALFVIPVIVASLFVAFNRPPIYEISFIRALGMALCTSLLVCSIALHDRKTRLWKQVFYTIFSFSLLFILPFVCPKFIRQNLWNLGEECNKLEKWQELGFGLYYHFSKLKYKISTFIVLGLVALLFLPFLAFCFYKTHWKYVRTNYGREKRNLWNARRKRGQDLLGILVGTGMTLFWASHLITIRNAMKDVIGKGDQERAWNYGQVTAVFAWVPLLLAVGGHLMGKSFHNWQ
jgi:hypothetical protein